jgi:butyryl-CoA dehydrogenase
MATLDAVTGSLLDKMQDDVDRGMANATLYLDMFGRILVSWIWLRQAMVAADKLDIKGLHESDVNFYRGKVQAARYYIQWELPQIYYQAELLQEANPVCFDMQEAWF